MNTPPDTPSTATLPGVPSPADTNEGDEPDSPSDSEPPEPPEPSESPVPPEPGEAQSQRAGLQVTATVPIDESDIRWIELALDRALNHVKQPVDSVSVIIVNDAAMSELHGCYLGDDSTTDVLTFDHREGNTPAQPIDCDIYICLDEAKRQAADLAWPPTRELLLYALHGILHCCGFDDHDTDGSARMHCEEDRILTAIGVGPTYGDAGGVPGGVPGGGS